MSVLWASWKPKFFWPLLPVLWGYSASGVKSLAVMFSLIQWIKLRLKATELSSKSSQWIIVYEFLCLHFRWCTWSVQPGQTVVFSTRMMLLCLYQFPNEASTLLGPLNINKTNAQCWVLWKSQMKGKVLLGRINISFPSAFIDGGSGPCGGWRMETALWMYWFVLHDDFSWSNRTVRVFIS